MSLAIATRTVAASLAAKRASVLACTEDARKHRQPFALVEHVRWSAPRRKAPSLLASREERTDCASCTLERGGVEPELRAMTYTDRLRSDLLREWMKTNRRREYAAERAREREAEARARGAEPPSPAQAAEKPEEASSPMQALGAWVGRHLRGSNKT